jgi:hypothetical protein
MPFDAAQVALWLKSNFLLLAELCLVLGLIVLAAFAPPPRWLQSLWRPWRRLAARPVAALLFPAALAIGLRLLLLPWAEVPYPSSARDEFSYLLAADTFASGRLTNPPHPQFRHFESPHVLFQPTYASKYPPGQGLVLALGQVLGHPWIGVLISVAVLIVAAGWAMRGWFPAPYALLGATLLALRIGVMSYWANTYWGGAVSAVGGALLIGALPRLMKKPSPLDGGLLGLGLGILALSRPFEGAIFSAITLALWTWLLFARAFAGGGKRASHAIVPLSPPSKLSLPPPRGIHSFRPLALALVCTGVVLAASLLWLGYYQAAVTGDPFVAPYSAWRQTYSRFETLAWETPVQNYKPVNEAYARFVYWAQENHELYDSPLKRLARLGFQVMAFFWGPMLACFLILAAPWLWKDPGIRLLALAVGLAVLAEVLLVDLWTFSHYLAPLTVALSMLGVQAIRIVVAGARGRFGGARPGSVLLLLGLPVVLLAMNAAGLILRNTDRLWTTPTYDSGWCCFATASERSRVEQTLKDREGLHVVFVRHPPEGYWGAEWVYNGASIDSGKIVWAREVSPEADCALRRYYSGRQVWLTYVHESPARLTPFPDPACAVSETAATRGAQ